MTGVIDQRILGKILYGFDSHYLNLIRLIDNDSLPSTILLSGKKGQGKFTLVHHILSYYFDKINYDIKSKKITDKNILYQDIKKDFNANIFYFNCSNTNIKIDEIRKLKSDLQKSSINNLKRFIIFDDVEYLSDNCINALLKTIEEPTVSNNFILINNKNNSILDTLKSRSIEINIFQKNKERIEIIENLISDLKIDSKLDYINTSITPGSFLKFNKILTEENLDYNAKLIVNIDKLLKLYKQNKDKDYINFAIYLINQFYFKRTNIQNVERLSKKRNLVIKKIDEFNRLNLNQSNIIIELEQSLQ